MRIHLSAVARLRPWHPEPAVLAARGLALAYFLRTIDRSFYSTAAVGLYVYVYICYAPPSQTGALP